VKTEKYCPACKTTKPTSDFHRRHKGQPDLNDRCKDCVRVKNHNDYLLRMYGRDWGKDGLGGME